MATLAKPLAVVTGASTGIGFHLAKQAAERGYDLVIAADGPRIENAAEELRALGVRVEAVREVLVLNAGIGVGGNFSFETKLEDELDMINLNILSTVRLAKWGTRKMVDAGRGRLLITASIAGIMPTPLETVYGATKAFDLSFAASLRHELKDSGVTVTAVLPGPTDTEFFTRAGLDDTKVAEEALKNQPEEVARQAFDALLAGKERVVAGNFSVKLQGYLARFMPESTKAEMHRKMAEHGSGEKSK